MSQQPKTRVLRLEEWPAADIAAWSRAQEPCGLLKSSQRPNLRWAAGTLRMNIDGYGRFLAWFSDAGRLDPLIGPADRVTPDVAFEYLKAMRAAGLADHTQAGRLEQLAAMLKVLAPLQDWSWVSMGAGRVRAESVPTRDKEGRLQSAGDVFQLGLKLMRSCNDDPAPSPVTQARQYRDGLIIAFLILRPIRIANLAALTLGTEVHRRGNRLWIVFGAEKMKARRRHEFSWPEPLIDQLNEYLTFHRPVLLRESTEEVSALWVSSKGTRMCVGALSRQIKLATKREFGAAINPHAFRDCAATTIATETPERVTDVMAVLAHSSRRVGEKHYIKASMADATKRHQDVVAQLRRSASTRSR